ncbi:MAG: hypothetical protein JWN08_3840 [Frankiales bacterium]|nr:hypothetical protein [Frankiales bacterium]
MGAAGDLAAGVVGYGATVHLVGVDARGTSVDAGYGVLTRQSGTTTVRTPR